MAFIHAPYRGDGPMQPDLIAGRLGFAGGAAFADRLRKDSAAEAATLKRLKLAAG